MRTFHVFVRVLLVVVLASCATGGDEIDQLEARIVVLEERVAEIDGQTLSARSLQESQEPPPTSVAGEPSAPEPDVAASGLIETALRTFAGATFLGVDDPEFGGTTIKGDATTVNVRLFRAGIEDRSYAVQLLRELGFRSDVLEGVESVESVGTAISNDGTVEASWTTTSEEVILELRVP